MKAVVIEEFGPAEGLRVTEVPEPVPAAGQVLIETEAIGVGGVDAVIRRGTLNSYGFQPGFIPGSEVAGTVVAVGEGVDEGLRGRRVWAFAGMGGGYAERVAASDFLPIPDALSSEDAVAIGTSGPVAHFALEQAHFRPGETVLVRGAAGSIGVSAIQLAVRDGAKAVAVTTSSAERGERLKALGATQVLDRAGTGDDQYDVIIDLIAGEHLPGFFDKLNRNGRLVVVGIVGGMPPADFGMKLMQDFRRSLSFVTFSADTVSPEAMRTVREEQFRSKDFKAVVHEVLKLDEAALAHQKMDDGEVFGRIVLKP
ncbi:zinc-binding dehydrogenase [Amycolatopsis rhabdoformis]|uniref:Zinc-binding dehydrogenase n=1 Tax=Amycolatopsis rhabdoformis TaxID=1448059 RepID=A0ABZ1HYM0_9PSEU|nr:zinc-binding dehydrogenase [Amycolatopsis rhabdoformis]WSE27240.1 zinc-binding dehydrogenase [Amycolatopsis rhabdoformis]